MEFFAEITRRPRECPNNNMKPLAHIAYETQTSFPVPFISNTFTNDLINRECDIVKSEQRARMLMTDDSDFAGVELPLRGSVVPAIGFICFT